MLLTLINRDLWTTIYLFRRAVVGLLDISLPSFPDLTQPLPWALLKSSMSLPTLCRFLPTVLRYVTLTTSIKTTQNCLHIGDGESIWIWASIGRMAQLITCYTLRGGPAGCRGRSFFGWENSAFFFHRDFNCLRQEDRLSSTPNDSLNTFTV
jgi:hypothetical protein